MKGDEMTRNHLTAQGETALSEKKATLVERHCKQVRDYESMLASYERLRRTNDVEAAQIILNRAYLFFEDELLRTQRDLITVMRVENGEIWR